MSLTEAPKDVPPEEPAKRTGADDPLEELDPEDPLGIRPASDPYAQSDPNAEPTWNHGVPLPPPAPAAAPADPPGRVNLRAALQRFTDRLPTISGTESPDQIAKLEPKAQAGRNDLGVHWTATTDVLVANLRAKIATRDDPDFDLVNKLQDAIGMYPEFGNGLSAWCLARDKVPPDEAALASALTQAIDSLNHLKARLEGLGFDPGALAEANSVQAQTIRLLAEASLKLLADEGATIMSGARVPRGAPSEGMSAVLEMNTADQNFQDRLSQGKTWGDAGRYLTNAIGRDTLKAAVSPKTGIIDFTRAGQELGSLDTTLKARKYAADPTDPKVQTAVYNDYLAVIDAHAEQLQKLRDAAKVAPAGKSAWTPAKLREATDLVVGMLRCVKGELAADPLVQDPGFAERTRQMLGQIDDLAGQTSLEADSQACGSDLRTVWKTAKAAELSALKKAGVDTKKLVAVFDAGLGPALDAWTTELAKFPKHDREKLKDLAAQSAAYISSYRAAVDAIAGPMRSSNLVHALDTVALAMTRQLRSYDARGGLF